jgi:hypothetical protein
MYMPVPEQVTSPLDTTPIIVQRLLTYFKSGPPESPFIFQELILKTLALKNKS